MAQLVVSGRKSRELLTDPAWWFAQIKQRFKILVREEHLEQSQGRGRLACWNGSALEPTLTQADLQDLYEVRFALGPLNGTY